MEIIAQKIAVGLLKASKQKTKDQEKVYVIETKKEGL